MSVVPSCPSFCGPAPTAPDAGPNWIQSASDPVDEVVLAAAPDRVTLAEVTMTTDDGFLMIWATAGFVSTSSSIAELFIVVDGVDETSREIATPFGGFTGLPWPTEVSFALRVPVSAGSHTVTFQGSRTAGGGNINVTDGNLLVAEVAA